MTRARISMIAAIGQANRALGLNNKLLWNLPEDLKHFKKITSGHPVIMGSKTFISIGRPLPGRTNIVVTRDKNFKPDGCVVIHSPEEALTKGKEVAEKEATGTDNMPEVFIIGGGEIYKHFMPSADRLYLTLVRDDKEGDVFFPDYSQFKNVIEEKDVPSNPPIKWLTLEK